MPHKHPLEVQGHRGARGLKPENTLPSFEAAFDAGVTSIETDVRLSADGIAVLFHDEILSDRLCRIAPGSSAGIDFHEEPWVSSFSMAELRNVLVDRNPDPQRFPRQAHDLTPVAELFALQTKAAPFGIVSLNDLYGFARAYAGAIGKKAGKTAAQRRQAGKILFDIEIKRVPFVPEAIGDGYTGVAAGHLESKLVETIHEENMLLRTRVRSFDHRALKAIHKLEPRLATAALIAATAPVSPSALCRLAHAEIYAPDYRSVDEDIVQKCHARKIKVMPWTVNESKDWEKLIAWGVDGISTDYPDHLVDWLRKHHMQIV